MYFSIHQYTFPYILCIRVHYIAVYMPFHAVLSSKKSSSLFQIPKSLSILESPSKAMFTFLYQQIKSSQKSLVNGHVINKCSRDSLSAPQKIYNGEAIKPVLCRKAFVIVSMKNFILKLPRFCVLEYFKG